MPLILFSKKSELLGFTFKADTAYDVQDRLVAKFVNQMGIAVPITEGSVDCDVEPNPMADYKFPEPKPRREKVLRRKVAKALSKAGPIPAPEDAPVVEEPVVEEVEEVEEAELETDATYSIFGRGGPWFDVVDQLGTKVNDKPLKKSDAEDMLNELVNKDTGETEV